MSSDSIGSSEEGLDPLPDGSSTTSQGEVIPHVLLVEDSPTDAEEYKYFLERSGLLRVDLGEVYPNIEQYSEVPLDTSVSAVIVDQFLAENTGVAYGGVDVAEYLRVVAPELPVFVLTNFAGELEEQAGSVDLVITKGKMRKYADTYIMRILRHIGQYRAALDGRQYRLQELIDLELNGELESAGQNELAELRRNFERATDFTLKQSEERQDTEVKKNEEHTRTLQELLAHMQTINARLEKPDEA